MAEEGHGSTVNLDWDDSDVLPAVLSPDTEFVFRRMTEETLKAAGPPAPRRVLDVGCGRAIDAAALAREGGVLFGCEPSRVMLRKAREGLQNSGAKVSLVSSLAEKLPFAGGTFHRVVCKGAIDHFVNPEQAVAEMSRVTSPDGRVVISVANFESLSCFLARAADRLIRRFRGRGIPPPRIWEIPRDHTHKFDHAAILTTAGRHLRIESVLGVSLFWGFPRWPWVLERTPKAAASVLLGCLDRIARRRPEWSDVLIVVGSPLPFVPEMERSV
jgi:SAM-dependent methyltransferase